MLITGFTIGFFTAGRMARIRINKHRKMTHDISLEKQFISKKIGLSKSQETEIFPLLDPMLTQQQAIRKEHHTAMKAERNKMFESIKPHLNPNQVQKMQQLMQKKRPPVPPHH
jgi:hypothetical protein